MPGLNTLALGWQYWHMQGRPVQPWIDDVVVDQGPDRLSAGRATTGG